MKTVPSLVIASKKRIRIAEAAGTVDKEFGKLWKQGINWIVINGSEEDKKDFFDFLKLYIPKTELYIEDDEILNFRSPEKGQEKK